MTRIFIADPQSKVRFALKVVLESQYQIQVVGAAETSRDLLFLLKQTPADLLLLDSNLPGMDIKDLVAELHKNHPALRTLVMGTDPGIKKKLPGLNVDDYINKGEAASHLFDTLQRYSVLTPAH